MKRALSIAIIGTLFSCIYISIALYEKTLGFKFLEPLFISDRLHLLFSNDIKTLEIFYFTYPSLSLLLAIPALIIDPILAPVITSSIAMGFFSSYLIVELYSKDLKLISVLVSIYLLCSPAMLSIATSGTSLYLYFILYYFFFSFLFRYTRDYTTYNFVMMSLCLTLFVLLDYQFLWMMIFVVPIIFFFSLFNSTTIQKSYVGIFEELTQNKSSTRELINKSFSTILVIIFTPLLSLSCFMIINYWFTGNFLFFETSQTTSWDQNPLINQLFYTTETTDIYLIDRIENLLLSCLFLSPVYLTSFVMGRKKLLFHLILLLAPIWIIYKLNSNPLELLSLQDLLIITASGIAAFIHLFQTALLGIFRKSKILHTLSFTLLGLSLCGEYYYFDHSKIPQEQNMFAFIKQEAPLNTASSLELIEYLNNHIPKGSKLLTDNTLTYGISALTREKVIYVDQFDFDYYDAFQAPGLFADYILIPQAVKPEQLEARLNVTGHRRKYAIEYQNADFTLLKTHPKTYDSN